MSRIVMWIWVYVLPLPVCVVMYWVWLKWSGSQTFTLYAILLPLVYGYVAPGIATNLLKKWRFRGAGVIGSFYIHHGFMYAANMSPLLFITFFGCSTHQPLTLGEIVRVVLCTAALHGYVLWIHDVYIVRLKMVEIFNRPAAEGKSPEAIVFHYAPLAFFTIGLTYAISSLVAFEVFVLQRRVSSSSIISVSVLGMILMLSLPSLIYRYFCD